MKQTTLKTMLMMGLFVSSVVQAEVVDLNEDLQFLSGQHNGPPPAYRIDNSREKENHRTMPDTVSQSPEWGAPKDTKVNKPLSLAERMQKIAQQNRHNHTGKKSSITQQRFNATRHSFRQLFPVRKR